VDSASEVRGVWPLRGCHVAQECEVGCPDGGCGMVGLGGLVLAGKSWQPQVTEDLRAEKGGWRAGVILAVPLILRPSSS
jgi:hypothetical protein